MHKFILLSVLGFTFLFCVVELCTQKLRIQKVAEKAGDKKIPLAVPSRKMTVTIWIVCFLLIVLALVTRSSFLVILLMCGISDCAMYLTCREDSHNRNNGIYGKGIVVSGTFTEYDSIKSIARNPELLMLTATLESEKSVQLVFASEQEYSAAEKAVAENIGNTSRK